jgi:Guanylate-binding protein, C-terminal domain
MLKKVKPKTLRGKVISGSMLIELAESYIGAMNSGKVPTIDTAWQNVQKSELERALH